MCGSGSGGPIPPPQENPCPKQLVIKVNDIFHSGNKDIWDKDVTEGTVLNIELDQNDLTIILLFDGMPIGRIYDQLIYKCIKDGYKYKAVVTSKPNNMVRLIRDRE
ncbi:hypothetical protein [Desulfofundulus thermocisternus]|uniref:hypothetical protein n=1 Tax=Desulfofundulus thermocisternus TaxID=42471 RepID=UPI00217CDCEB|nr:hypothetical protein [Desulfofundulus thermocisternus]MCS5697339.1 hypothetical protein [Desulfofundulus thermocisternus]